MPAAHQDFAETYRRLPDEDIAALNAQRDTLTDQARDALTAEIRRRGMSDVQLAKLHALEHRGEAKFDRREKKRRKMASGLLFSRWRLQLMGAALALYVLLWIYERISRHH